MSIRKAQAGAQGIVASESLNTIFQREIFFQVDPMTLDYLDGDEVAEQFPSGFHVDMKTEDFLQFLPELEQEIFYLLYDKAKHQKDVAKLLSLSQPTVSYRYRRVLMKLAYIMILTAVDPDSLLLELEFLSDRDRNVIRDLLFFTNQEKVGQKHDMRQSSVKWIFMKAKRQMESLEREDPDKWQRYYGLFVLLERNLGARIQNE